MPKLTNRIARKASQLLRKGDHKPLNLNTNDIRVESSAAYDLQSVSDAGTPCIPHYLRMRKRNKPTDIYTIQESNVPSSESRDSRVSVATNELGIKKGKTLKKAKSMVVIPSSGRSSANDWNTIEEGSVKAAEAEDVPVIRPSNPKMPGGWPTSSPKPADSDKKPTLATSSSGAVKKSMGQGQQSNRSSTDTVRHRPSQRVVATSTSSLPQSLERFPPFEDSTGQQQLADTGFEQTPSDICVRLPSNPDMPTHMYRHPLMKAQQQQISKFSFSSADTTETKGKGKALDSDPSFLKEIDQRLRNLPTLQTSSTLSTLASLLTKEPLPPGKTLRHKTLRHKTLRHKTLRHKTLRHKTRHKTLRHKTLRHKTLRHKTLPKTRRWASLETDISSGQELLEQAELKKRFLKRAGVTATTKEEKQAWDDLSSNFSQSLGSLARELGVNSQSLPASSSSIPPPVPSRIARRQPSRNFSRPFSTSSVEPVIAPRQRGPAPKFGFDSRAFSINTDEEQTSANDTFFGNGASIYALPPPAIPLPSIIEDDDKPLEQPETVFAAVYDAMHRALVLVHRMRNQHGDDEERLAHATGQSAEFERLYRQERARADHWEYRARILSAEGVIRQAEADGRDAEWVVEQLREMNVPLPERYGYGNEENGQVEQGIYADGGEEMQDEEATGEGEQEETIGEEGGEEGYDADMSSYQQGDVAYTSPMRQEGLLSSSMVWQTEIPEGVHSEVSYSVADITDTSNIPELEI